MYVCMCVCVCKTLNLSAVYLKYNFVNQLYSKKKKKRLYQSTRLKKGTMLQGHFHQSEFQKYSNLSVMSMFSETTPFLSK